MSLQSKILQTAPGPANNGGFKLTDAGVVPDDWSVKLLPEVCRFRGGKAHEQYVSELGKFVCVNSKFISSNGHVLKFASRNLSPAKAGDILMVMSDLPNGKALAKAFIADRDEYYAVNQRVCALTPYKDCSKYLYYTLNRSPYFLKFDDGVNQTHLLNPIFRKCPVTIPSTFAEQEAIAEALSDVDASIDSLETLIAKKRQIKQGAMQELLSGQRRLPGFKDAWRTYELGRVVRIRNEKIATYGSTIAAFCIELEDVGQGTGDLTGSSDASNRTTMKYAFFAGDVLFGRLRPYLRKFWQADRSGVCSTEIWPLIPIGLELDAGFLRHVVQTDAFIEAASAAYGTHMPRADWKALSEFKLSLPPTISEQSAIANVLSDMDAEIFELHRKLAKVEQLKQGMMQELLTGRVRLL